MFSFEVTHADGTARRGVLTTPHGVVETPAFLPVGTAGSVKGLTPAQLADTGAQMILANTYHLQLRPTGDVVRELGGLHQFMGWNGPILTDSGGYQVFSLAKISCITDEGVEFRSHVDGAPMRLDPRIATEIQNKLGADIIMAFDQCPPLPADAKTVRTAVERTIRWARICKDVHSNALVGPTFVGPTFVGPTFQSVMSRPRGLLLTGWKACPTYPRQQAMFGVVQGGLDLGQRQRCAEALIEIGFDGYAIGGLSVGESREEMVGMLGPVASFLPADQPRHLMGVGMPGNILAAVMAGVDLFDCVLPTRNGRNSHAFTATGPLKMRNEKYRLDTEPFERDCDCETCRRFSRGYIRHLFNTGEMLGPTLTSIHNLRFYQRFMARIRDLICDGKLARIVDEYPIASANYELRVTNDE